MGEKTRDENQMKLLVTGGCGFIGGNFIRYWLKKYPKDQIINLDKLTYAGHLSSTKDFSKSKNYEFIEGDICDPKVVDKIMKGVDFVVHFAAESHVDRSITGPQVFIKTNVIGTQVLLDAALEHEVKRFHHVSCYDSKTKAFTRDGLKAYNQIKTGDMVLSLNIKTRKVEWMAVEKVIVQEYSGKMFRMKSQTVDFFVTPNHRMLIQTKKSKKLVFKDAENVAKGAVNKLPKHYEWLGKTPTILKQFGDAQKEFMYLLGIFIGDGFTGYQEKKTVNKSGLTKRVYLQISRDESGRFAEMGHVGTAEYTVSRSWRIFLDIPEKDKSRHRCESALTNLGINWHAHKGNAGEHLYFNSEKFFHIFENCGKLAKGKKIPEWALNAPKELLESLWEGLMDSDGSKRRIFYTVSTELAYQFMELCVKIGLSPNLSRRYTKSVFEGRKIEGWSYFISISKQWRVVRKEIIKEVDYQGKVWCLKVENNRNFLIERSGKTAFCGNTDEVFGALPLGKGKFDERTCYDPRSPYSASKAASDHLVRAYHETYGLPITITNCSNNFGPYQDPEKMLPRSITNLIDGQSIMVYGDGKYVRDWLYVEDHIRAIDLAIHKGKVGETYLVGGLTKDVNNLEIAKKLSKIFKQGRESIKFVKDRPGHDRRYAVNWSKIKNELGWKPKYDFGVWLAKTVEWYQENEWWWRPLKEESEKLYAKTGQR